MEIKERKILGKVIKLKERDSLTIAQRYFSLISAISDIKLTEREIQLIAFLSIRGNISYSSNREEFCTLYNSSSQTINNIIYRLKKVGVLIKENNKVKINPKLVLDFNNNLVIQISISHG